MVSDVLLMQSSLSPQAPSLLRRTPPDSSLPGRGTPSCIRAVLSRYFITGTGKARNFLTDRRPVPLFFPRFVELPDRGVEHDPVDGIADAREESC